MPVRNQLNEKDKKDLRYQCRMGIILPVLFLIISNLLLLLIIHGNSLKYSNMFIQIVIVTTVLGSAFMNYFMNRKYIADIKNGDICVEIKKVQAKEMKTDYEAGSATLYIGQKMKEFKRYDLIVENTRYRVEKELFENCETGDQLAFLYAPQSRYLLEIVLKRNN